MTTRPSWLKRTEKGGLHSCWRGLGRLAIAVLFLASAGVCRAQGLAVSSITVDGQSVNRATGVQVRLPGTARAEAQVLEVGRPVVSGTELTLPRGVRIELTSRNGNRIVLYPGARFLTGVVTARGESHQPLAGRAAFQVRKSLDFFNIQHERITASVKGTEFTVDIEPARSLTVTVSEGVVEVERQVQFRVVETPAAPGTGSGAGIRAAEDLRAGQSRTYRLDVEEYLAEFRNFAEAEAYFRNALAEAEASGDQRRILRAVQNLMELYVVIGKPRATLELEGRCVDLARGISSLASESICVNHAGIAYDSLGQYRRGIVYHERALAIVQGMYGTDHHNIGASFGNLGNAYYSLAEYRKAIEYHEKDLAMRERLSAGRDDEGITIVLNNLGNVHAALGEDGKALGYYENSRAIAERLYAGRDHPHIARSFTNIGNIHRKRGESRTAIAYYEKSVAMQQRLYAGRDHPGIAMDYINLGNAHKSLGEFYKARGYIEASLAIYQRVYPGRDHPHIAQGLNDLGNVYFSLGEMTAAIGYYQRSLMMRERLYGTRDHGDFAESLKNLGSAYRSVREHLKAIDYHQKSLAMEQRLYGGRDHPHIAQSVSYLGTDYLALGEARKAIAYFEDSLAMLQRLYGDRDHPEIAQMLNNIGFAYGELREYRKAIPYHDRSLAMRERLYAGLNHPDVAQSYYNLGNAYYSLREYRKAIEYHEKSVAMREQYLGRDHPDTVLVVRELADAYEGAGNSAEAARQRARADAMQRRLNTR